MATKPANNPLKAGLQAAIQGGLKPANTTLPKAAPKLDAVTVAPEIDEAQAFRDAVAGIAPLPPDNRVQLSRPPARRLSPPAASKTAATTGSANPHRGDSLPESWRDATPVRSLPRDPEQAALMLAMAGVAPLPDRNRIEPNHPRPKPQPLQHLADERAALSESLHGPIALQDRLEGGDEPQHLRAGLSQTVLRDLRRGRWVVQGEIDLHGLNRDEARQGLAEFLADSLQQGRRCIRVVHGKGLGSPQKLSILRQLVRGWLAQREEVLAYCQARPHDGGEGALIVLLRAPKK